MTTDPLHVALEDGASALRYRAERLRAVAPEGHREAEAMVADFLANARRLESLQDWAFGDIVEGTDGRTAELASALMYIASGQPVDACEYALGVLRRFGLADASLEAFLEREQEAPGA